MIDINDNMCSMLLRFSDNISVFLYERMVLNGDQSFNKCVGGGSDIDSIPLGDTLF